MKTHYTVGFLFSFDKQKVALIRKQRPDWQKGRLNGVGGHVEIGETALQCMGREFHEEVEYPSLYKTEWRQFAVLDSPKFIVDCFASLGDLAAVKGKTDEDVEIINVDQITPLRTKDMIENLPWLISMAIDFIEDGRPAMATVEYKD
jgi:8-oxo-dGTP diphosphatase